MWEATSVERGGTDSSHCPLPPSPGRVSRRNNICEYENTQKQEVMDVSVSSLLTFSSICILFLISVSSLVVATYSAVNLSKSKCNAGPLIYTIYKPDDLDQWNHKYFHIEAQNVTFKTFFHNLVDVDGIDNCIQELEISEFEYSTNVYLNFNRVISCADSSLKDKRRSSVHSVVQTKYITDQDNDADVEDAVSDVSVVTSPISYGSGMFSGCKTMTVTYDNTGAKHRVISFL